MTINSRDIRIIFLIGFLTICIFFPGDPYGIKLIFLALLFASGINVYLRRDCIRKYGYLYIMGVVFPFVVLVFSIVIGGHFSASVAGVYPAVLILVTIIVLNYYIDYEKILFSFLQVLAVLTLVIILLDIGHIINVNEDNFIRNAFYNYDMGIMGKSTRYAVYYKVFFKSSPLFIMLIPYSFKRNKLVMATLTFFALLFSGTRANIFIASIVYVFGFIDIWSQNKKSRSLRFVLGGIIVLIMLLMLPNIIALISEIMNTTGSINSDLIRAGQLSSFKELFSNPFTLLFGMGFGTSFFDIGRMSYTTASEIAYLDLLRKIGLIWFIPFMIFVVKPLWWKIDVHTKIAYVGYLLICFTNPLLFSSTAYVLYIYLYSSYGLYSANKVSRNV